GVHGGGEILGSHPGERRAELLVRDERRRVVGRCLRLHLRAVGLARAGLDTQLDKLGPAGLRWFADELVGRAVLDGDLVDTELWMLGHGLGGDGTLTGLEVDHVHASVVVDLDAVHRAAQAYGIAADRYGHRE